MINSHILSDLIIFLYHVLPEFVELLFKAGHVIDLGSLFGHFLYRIKAGLDETGGERFLQLQFVVEIIAYSTLIL